MSPPIQSNPSRIHSQDTEEADNPAPDGELRAFENPQLVVDSRKGSNKGADAGAKRGICYLSRIPPRMDPTKLRHILSQYGDIRRIYLLPKDSSVQVQHKRNRKGDGFRDQQFSEGWVEFTKRSVAKKVANMINGEQIGGKRRSPFFYDTWNIKYLSKFKWDNLTSETAENSHTREQKLTLELSAAKRERDFYLKKVDQFKASKFIQQRMKKKQKTHGEGFSGDDDNAPAEAKVIRRFPQNRPVADRDIQGKPGLSKDILAEVFGSST